MKTLMTTLFLLVTTLAFNNAWSQETNQPMEPMTSVDIAASYVPNVIIEAAKQMPEEYYSFKPTSEVRSFGELMLHIAESTIGMVALAKGETPPDFEAATTKADIIKMLKTSFEYATEVRKSVSKERKAELVEFNNGTNTAGNVLDFTIFHALQHYGNAIVYLRLKGLVPPSSQ